MLISLRCREGHNWQEQFFTLLTKPATFPQIRLSPQANAIQLPSSKWSYSLKLQGKTACWAEKTNGFSVVQVTTDRTSDTTHGNPSAKPICPYRLGRQWTMNKCLVNLLSLGCQQWYSRVQCAWRVKIQHPQSPQSNQNLKKEFE